MKIRRVAAIVAAGIITASCSDRSTPARDKDANAPESTREADSETAERDEELQPREDEIAEDCVAFLRATKVNPAQTPSTDCPGCPAGGAEVLTFREMKTDRISCSGDTCEVAVTIRAFFNPGSGETLAGGLTAWIPPEQRNEYLSGSTPSGEQQYRVKITYKRRGQAWRAAEFDRADAK